VADTVAIAKVWVVEVAADPVGKSQRWPRQAFVIAKTDAGKLYYSPGTGNRAADFKLAESIRQFREINPEHWKDEVPLALERVAPQVSSGRSIVETDDLETLIDWLIAQQRQMPKEDEDCFEWFGADGIKAMISRLNHAIQRDGRNPR